MAIGTDKDIFGAEKPERVQTGGRPQVNRKKILQLLKANVYTTAQIAKACKCSSKTVNRAREEFERDGSLENDEMKGRKTGATVEADFDEECKRARGFSFYDWMEGKFTDKSAAHSFFNFARKCWSSPENEVWDSPSLVRAADANDPLGDQMCIRWLKIFGEDEIRIRSRKKQIRFFFRFLKRSDLNDAHLTMSRAKDPLQKREVPQISLTQFPLKFNNCIEEMEKINPKWATLIRTKLVFMARTGEKKRRRGIFGLTKNGDGGSWLIMEKKADGSIETRGNILDKGRIDWIISYFPAGLKAELFPYYEATEVGDTIFKESELTAISKAWKKITNKYIGRPFKLHDLRKVSATWYYSLRVPIEILAQINVGWKDLNTIKEHYLQLRGLLKRSERAEYSANIPEWFKEEIEEFTDQ